MLHDIRDQLPRTDQTNPAKFPQYEYKPYPRAMYDEKGKAFKDAAKRDIVIQDAAEEKAFRAQHPNARTATEIDVASTGVTTSAIAALTNESEELIRLRAELAAHKAMLAAESVVEKRKPGRPAKVDLPKDLD